MTMLYTFHGDAVRRFIAGHVVDVQHREDIVQETFARAWKNIDQIDTTDGNPRSFLFTIARNVVVDQWRRRSRRGEVLVDTDIDIDTALPGADDVNKSLERIVIGESLQRLSPEHREVVRALYFDDLTLAQAADRLNIAVGTVKSRSYYAVRALRAVFDEMGLL
ncbi:RNA polymerase sigma-70 factor (ECF subfamily) [Mycobacterium frederiksbergense]|uniref:RNA polymerase sigma-70 factor (ECF subfamily) n=1 Tax=Mycolicibacterium frederiksbergense TaxID=117567 RepID=A0ABT6KZ98_9MYCO|nr:RNA polymerase sigma-70 factor (ECF subfamily) [Mycolicibacterium frederiksbergense]